MTQVHCLWPTEDGFTVNHLLRCEIKTLAKPNQCLVTAFTLKRQKSKELLKMILEVLDVPNQCSKCRSELRSRMLFQYVVDYQRVGRRLFYTQLGKKRFNFLAIRFLANEFSIQ